MNLSILSIAYCILLQWKYKSLHLILSVLIIFTFFVMIIDRGMAVELQFLHVCSIHGSLICEPPLCSMNQYILLFSCLKGE